MSAVSFDKAIVYSPINANHHVKITVSKDDKIASLDLNSLLSIPSQGTKRISSIIQEQQQRLLELENNIEPAFSSVRQWASDTFSIPVWLKAIIFFAFALGTIAFAQFLYKTIGKKILNVFKPRNNNDTERGHDYADPRLTNNPLYPPLPQVNVPMQQFTRPLVPLPAHVTTPFSAASASESTVPMIVAGAMPAVGVDMPAGPKVLHGEAAMPTSGQAHSAVSIE